MLVSDHDIRSNTQVARANACLLLLAVCTECFPGGVAPPRLAEDSPRCHWPGQTTDLGPAVDSTSATSLPRQSHPLTGNTPSHILATLLTNSCGTNEVIPVQLCKSKNTRKKYNNYISLDAKPVQAVTAFKVHEAIFCGSQHLTRQYKPTWHNTSLQRSQAEANWTDTRVLKQVTKQGGQWGGHRWTHNSHVISGYVQSSINFRIFHLFQIYPLKVNYFTNTAQKGLLNTPNIERKQWISHTSICFSFPFSTACSIVNSAFVVSRSLMIWRTSIDDLSSTRVNVVYSLPCNSDGPVATGAATWGCIRVCNSCELRQTLSYQFIRSDTGCYVLSLYDDRCNTLHLF